MSDVLCVLEHVLWVKISVVDFFKHPVKHQSRVLVRVLTKALGRQNKPCHMLEDRDNA